MDGLRQAWQGIRERFGAMSVNQRMVLGMVATAVVISAGVFSLVLGHEEQVVLFSNLSLEDANRALDELNKRDVAAELTNGGTTVKVPASQVHRLRVELASEGIPSSGVVGFEIFDHNKYGMTEQDFEVQRLRALQGELTKTIENLRGVESARVHLVMPKSSIFRALASEPTASVVLSLNRQRSLGQSQIAGIQSLVAGSVESLRPDNVTVLDQYGQALSASYGDDAYGASDRQLELKKEVETYLSEKAQSLLSGVLGAGRSMVRVDATLNFEQLESERTVFDPKGSVVRSEERNEANDPQNGGTTESSMTNYEINQTVERIVGETGGISGLSVAVFVDGTYATPEGGGEPIYSPLPQDQLDNIRRVVQRAVGLSAERGDQIEVVNIQFQDGLTGEETGGGLPGGWFELVTRHGGRVLMLIMLISLVLTFRRSLAAALGELASLRGGPASAAGVAGGAGQGQGQDGQGEVERFEGLPEMTDQMVEDVREYAAENPERVAEVIQSWVYEPEPSSGR